MTFASAGGLWGSAWPAGLMMVCLGAALALMLLVARDKLRVDVDETVGKIQEALPKLDCGACGFAGCAGYAKAVAADAGLIGRCTPGGQPVAGRLAEILGLESGRSGVEVKPVVHCSGDAHRRTQQAQYLGIATCAAANTLQQGQACSFGCLGFGDCRRACRFGGVHPPEPPKDLTALAERERKVDFQGITMQRGLATIDYDRCVGCGACARACPRGIIEMVPFRGKPVVAVACRSEEKGKVTRSMCEAGCIGCGLCAKLSGLFVVENNLARVDYAKYGEDEPTEETMKAKEKCPAKVIVLCGKGAVTKAEEQEVGEESQGS